MNLGVFTDLHKLRHICLEYFHHLERRPRTFHSQVPIPPSLHPLCLALATTFLLSLLICLFFRHFTWTGPHDMCSSVSGFLPASCSQSSSILQGVSAHPFLFNGQITFHCMGLLMLSCQVTSYSLRPHDYSFTRFLCLWISRDKNTALGCHPSPGILPTPGIEPCYFFCIAGRFLPLSCRGKPGMDTVHCLPIIRWWTSGLFPLWAIVNNDAMNIHTCFFVDTGFYFS